MDLSHSFACIDRHFVNLEIHWNVSSGMTLHVLFAFRSFPGSWHYIQQPEQGPL